MKVIHLISGGDTGGAKTHVHSLLQNLTRTIDVTMVCFMDGPFVQEARELGIPTVVIPGRNPAKVLTTLKDMAQKERYDLIHCHGARGNLMGSLLHRATGIPVVTTVHSDYRLDYLGRPLSRLSYGTINTIMLRCMDYHIGVSDAMTDLLISRGFDPDRLFTIYNGLDFSPRPTAMEREEYLRACGLSFDGESVVVGIAARLDAVKDVGTLIRGFAKAYETHKNLRLLIAGEGGQGQELRTLAAQLLPGDVYHFCGWISDTDTFYNALDVNTLTSLSETFPYAITEGARAGLPTVASRVGGIPYLIQHGVTGLLFEPGDPEGLARCLGSLAADRTLRAHLGQRLHDKAESEFSLDSTLRRQLDIYSAILRKEARKKSRPTRRDGVLVCGAYGRGNAGDDAILEAIVREIRSIDSDLPVWVLSRKPKETRLQYRVNAIYTFHFLRFLRRMAHTDLYINGGGSLMQDVTSRRSLWFYLFTITMAKKLGNPVHMYGCGIGPVRYPSNRRLVHRVLEHNVDAITLRDTLSKAELEDMGVTRPKIVMAADPTVILPPAPASVVDGILENAGLDPDGDYIAFTVRPWPGFEEKAPVFAAAADYAWEKYKLTPLFLPIEPRLDVAVAQKVTAYIQKAPYHILPGSNRSDHIIGLFSRMKIAVSMRLHGLVFPASQGVPLIGVVYDPKVSSFLSYIDQDLCTELSDLTPERLKAHIDAAAARIGDSAFLKQSVDRLRQLEERNTQVARALLEGRV